MCLTSHGVVMDSGNANKPPTKASTTLSGRATRLPKVPLSVDYVMANKVTRSPSTKRKGPNRQGTKAIKKLERLSSSGDLTPRRGNTFFRALSARANCLAQGQPDLAFSTEALCRGFAMPNRSSFLKLSRVVRYSHKVLCCGVMFCMPVCVCVCVLFVCRRWWSATPPEPQDTAF